MRNSKLAQSNVNQIMGRNSLMMNNSNVSRTESIVMDDLGSFNPKYIIYEYKIVMVWNEAVHEETIIEGEYRGDSI